MNSEPVLSIRDLTVSLPHRQGWVQAVRGVSFDMAKGETVCIVGESGCGKSMTAMSILNLLPRGADRQATHLSFQGKDLLAASEAQLRQVRGAQIGVIFQEPLTALNPSISIGEQLMEVYRRHRPKDRANARGRAIEMLTQVGIPEPEQRMHQYPHHMSGGQRQRVIIAMALMCEPSLIIADEPTTALDVTIQAQILRLLIDLKDRLGLSLLLITHDLAVASRVADRIVVMYGGQVVEAGATKTFFSNPAHPYSTGLLGCVPTANADLRGKPLQVIPGTVPSLIGDLEGCTFRPRCPLATPDCAVGAIALRESADHSVRCIHANPKEEGVK